MRQALHSPRNEAGQKVAGYLCDGTPCGCHGGDGGRGRERSGAEGSQCEKKITIVKCALFIATQNGELGDECKTVGTFRRKTKTTASRPDEWPGR